MTYLLRFSTSRPRTVSWAGTFKLAALLLLLITKPAAGGDIFGTQSQVPPSPAAPLIAGSQENGCQQQPLTPTLLLFDAIERALCESPKTRSAWAAIKSAAAGVGLSKSAYLPTLDGSVKYGYEKEVTQVTDDPPLESHYAKAVNEETLQLGWVLYDFGARSASLKNSKALLLAAQANQNVTIQSIFASTARDYFGAQAAAARVSATHRIEEVARTSLNAATTRASQGVAPITDQFQANTALAQAVYERARAEGDLRSAIGTLAVDMSLSPDETLNLPELDSSALPDTRFVKAVHDLLEDAQQTHPKVLAAAAQWQASLANVHFVRAHGFPVLQLVGQSDHSSQPVSASLGQPELPAQTHENYIGLRIEIPIFAGFNRGYEIHQAEAQADVQEQGLRDVQQQVAVGVWSSVQILQAATDNLRNTDAVLESARQSLAATEHRYQSSVGNILELLSVQNTLAVAEQQWIQAQLDWRTARLQLAASLGTLGMWAIE